MNALPDFRFLNVMVKACDDACRSHQMPTLSDRIFFTQGELMRFWIDQGCSRFMQWRCTDSGNPCEFASREGCTHPDHPLKILMTPITLVCPECGKTLDCDFGTFKTANHLMKHIRCQNCLNHPAMQLPEEDDNGTVESTAVERQRQ